LGNYPLRRIVFLLFISAFVAEAQVIQRIHKNPSDIFVISDWKVYKPFSRVTDVVESNSYIYFATNGAGILRYDKFADQFTFPYTESNGLISNHIKRFYISEAEEGLGILSRVAIQTDRGRQAFQLEQVETFRFIDEDGSTFSIGRDSIKIKSKIGDDNFFLDQPYVFQKPNIVSGPEFQEFKIIGRYDDLSSGIWLIVDNFGFFYAPTRSSFFKPIRFGPVSGTVLDIEIVGDDIWMGQHSNNDRKKPVITNWNLNNEWTHFYEKYSMEINSPYYNKVITQSQNIWFGGKFGLLSYDSKKRIFEEYRFKGLYDTAIHDMHAVNDTIYIGTAKGLYYFNPKKKTVSQLKYPTIGNTDVLGVAANERYIFASTRFGLYRIDRLDYSIINFKTKLRFPNFKTDVIEYLDDKFWFNNSDGLFSYDPKTDSVKQIHLSSNFFNLDLRAIQVSKNNVFLATDKGLLIYYTIMDEWVWITRREGLPSNQLTDIALDGDYLIISSLEGVAEFLWNDPRREY
jgi:hypothetical protein